MLKGLALLTDRVQKIIGHISTQMDKIGHITASIYRPLHTSIRHIIITAFKISRFIWRKIIRVLLIFVGKLLLAVWRIPILQRYVKALTWVAALFSVWFICSTRTDIIYLGIGGGLSLLGAMLVYFLNNHFGKPLSHSLTWRIFLYFGWLLRAITFSTWDVTKRVWQLKPDISPTMEWVPANQQSHVGHALFGLSITLTPGTVAIQVEPGRILVHCLTKESSDDLIEGAMNRKIVAVGG